MRTSEQIQAEIEERLGFFPPFFAAAHSTPEILETLWQHTLSAYLNNPLPTLIKEKLSAYLSRYCAVPYCLICHSCSLQPLGMSALNILQLLESPPPTEARIQFHISVLEAQPATLTTWPDSGSLLEESIFSSAVYIFLSLDASKACYNQMQRVLGTQYYNHLSAFLAYLKLCHVWVEAHPEVTYELDQRAQKYLAALLQDAPRLNRFFRQYRQQITTETQNHEQQLLIEITQRQRIEAVLQETNQVLQALIHAAPSAIIALDQRGKVKLWNAAAAAMFGWKGADVVGQPLPIVSDAGQAEFQQLYQDICRGKTVTGLQVRRQRQDHSQIDLSLSAGPFYDVEGQLNGTIAVISDVTEQKRSQELLERLSHQNHLILNSAGEGIYGLDLQGHVTFVNPAASRMVGWEVEELIGQPMHATIHHSKLDGTPHLESDCPIYAAFKDGMVRQGIEDIFWCKNGTSFPVEYTSMPIREHEVLVGAVVTFKDITERKRAEAQLQQQTERDRLLADMALRIRRSLNLNDILQTAVAETRNLLQIERAAIYRIIPDQPGQFIVESVAPGCLSVLGIELHDPCFDVDYSHQYQQGRISVVDDIYQTSYLSCYLEFLERIQIRANLLVPIVSNDQLWGLLCAHQCSAPRHWEPFEIDSLQRLVTQLAIAIQQSELYEQVQRLNARLEQQVVERTVQLQQALDFEATLKRITDKVRDSLDEDYILSTAVKELAQGLGVPCCDTGLYNADHTISTISHDYSPGPSAVGQVIQMADRPEVYYQLIQGQHLQFCIYEGLTLRPIQVAATLLACPILDDQGVLGDLWLFRSSGSVFNELEIRLVQQVANQCAIAIRQARLYQRSRTQVAELEMLNRLKDDFLSTVSHELRTPISNMKMAIHMLRMAPSAERQERYLQILQTECAREAELINDLLDLQRLEAASYPLFVVESIDLQHWLPELLEPFQTRSQQHHQVLRLEFLSHPPTLISDRASLSRIIAELLNNACKYTPSKGQIVVQVNHQPQPKNLSTGINTSVTLAVRNQVEIPAAELPRIFEKFYRVPNADPWKQGGTGLGLALVQRLAERLKGTIRVDSGGGWTTFLLELPTQPSQEALGNIEGT
ncbi:MULTISPECIES: PAS domain S-box protein [Trichocoleus]|uniref:histidine kinase n=1 Tax=Trichocoleus desertorum GB2-A4 TaxID=2933944 RepID=A0ABV0J391_9CYAN|nr:PAS domain S-box protein [Trichocoleus sp. FACHB-46]MBD1861587.1 PAS domain S-box protein [Trichocoleus sp. FACHB-46]